MLPTIPRLFLLRKLIFIGRPHLTVAAVVWTISLTRRFTTYASVQFGRLTVSFDKMPLQGYDVCYNEPRLFLSPWPQMFSEDFTVMTSKI